MTPSPHDSVTISCPACGDTFVRIGRQRWCSGACRSEGYRRRKAQSSPSVVLWETTPRREHSVYACDACDTRSLGEQRCESCGSFMRRLGFGGLCPCCDEPVAAVELVSDASERKR